MDIHVNKQKFIDETRAKIPDFNEDLISCAWDFSKNAHTDQRRESGEPFFSHPVGVAYILLSVDCDSAMIAAALLHDVVEDTKVSIKEIKEKFGEEIASLVEGVTKLAPFDLPPDKIWTGEDTRLKNLRKLFVAIVDDPRVALVKLADRVHNLDTLGALPQDRRRRIASESLAVYAPLAEALGLGAFQSQIQDRAFYFLKPDIYQDIEKKLKEKWEEFKDIRELVIMLLEDDLRKAGMNALVYGRQKEIYSIYRKLMILGFEFPSVYDILGIRIIVNNEEECYEAKCIVDQLGEEVKYDDYIGKSRNPLGYQSLHKIVHAGDALIEFQIRSRAMHNRAERGSAAHWIYKLNGSSPDQELVKKINALRQRLEENRREDRDSSLGEFVKDGQEAHEDIDEDRRKPVIQVLSAQGDVVPLLEGSTPIDFAYYMHVELGDEFGVRVNGKNVPLDYKLGNGDTVEIIKRIRVFSPRGDVIALPADSTPIDFAYHIHTELGHECARASVNGKNVPLSYTLSDGDVVEIIRRKGSTPKLSWISEGKARSPRAQQKIRKYFLDQKRPEMIAETKTFVQKRLKTLSDPQIKTQGIIQALVKGRFLNEQTDEEDFYLAIADGRVSIERFNRIIGEMAVWHRLANVGLPKESVRDLVRWFADSAKTPIPHNREQMLFLAVAEGDISIKLLSQGIQELAARALEHPGMSAQQLPSEERTIEQGLSSHIAHCCYPVPGDPIIGFVTVNRGLSLHRVNCPEMDAMRKRQERLIEYSWQDIKLSKETKFSGKLLIELAGFDSRVYKKIEEVVIRAEGLIRERAHADTSKRPVWISLIVDVRDVNHLHSILGQLRKIDGITKVKRSLDDDSSA